MPDHPLPLDALNAERLAYAYGATQVLQRVDLDVKTNEIVALLGPSGCGKTTLLKLIAGLLAPTEGTLRIDGATVADTGAGHCLPPEKRGLGMVFQDYALWPHLSVLRNVSFPLEMRGFSRADWEPRSRAALARVGLGDHAERAPGAMSGGQQQRVSIARAIVAEPRLVLFDEPLSNLDRDLRDTLAGEISSLIRELGLSGVYVTHDQAEAFALADRVAVMRAGRIEQIDRPEQLISEPASPEVCLFLHLGTVTQAEVTPQGLAVPLAGVTLPIRPGMLPHGTHGHVLLRREALAPCPEQPGALPGHVIRSLFRGDHHLLTVRIGSETAGGLDLSVVAQRRATPGETIHLTIDTGRLRFFPQGDAGSLSLEKAA